MIPSNVILDAIPDLIAADTATLGDATACKVALVASPFTPSPDLVIGSLTLASFTGSTPLEPDTGPQTVFVDVETGYRTVQMIEPAGGWTWLCTATPSPAQTIYGYILTDNAGAVLYGSALLDSQVTISAAGQGLTIDRLIFRFPPSSPF